MFKVINIAYANIHTYNFKTYPNWFSQLSSFYQLFCRKPCRLRRLVLYARLLQLWKRVGLRAYKLGSPTFFFCSVEAICNRNFKFVFPTFTMTWELIAFFGFSLPILYFPLHSIDLFGVIYLTFLWPCLCFMGKLYKPPDHFGQPDYHISLWFITCTSILIPHWSSKNTHFPGMETQISLSGERKISMSTFLLSNFLTVISDFYFLKSVKFKLVFQLLLSLFLDSHSCFSTGE